MHCNVRHLCNVYSSGPRLDEGRRTTAFLSEVSHSGLAEIQRASPSLKVYVDDAGERRNQSDALRSVGLAGAGVLLELDKADVVVAALCDPGNVGQTPSSAGELTKKQSETVVEFLKGQKAFKTGLVSYRKVTPLGMGQGPSPVIEKGPMPPSYLQVVVFTPQ